MINCHMHIFKAEHVPPFLAKTYILWPVYYLLHLGFIVSLFRFWYKKVVPIVLKPFYKRLMILKTAISWFLNAINPIKIIISYYLTIQVFFITFDFVVYMADHIFHIPPPDVKAKVEKAGIWLSDHYLLLPFKSIGTGWKILLVLFVFLLIPSGRNLILFIFKSIWKFLTYLPGKEVKEMFRRYLNIGRYAFHTRQSASLQQICAQYPPGTGFVVLPMDMERMAAGPVKISYRDQMKELAGIKESARYKNTIFPFIFADPRRIADENDYFVYTVNNNEVVLGDCFIKEYFIDKKFSGIKIYPALGYYPFDERLLALWKYTADHQIPIITHCIRGTIFYRGSKKLIWNRHPVIKQAAGNNEYIPLLLPETNNVDFTPNFTHPLNYLCLLDETRLRVLVENAVDPRIKELFGFTNADTPLTHDLSHLKLCFGHFGGDDEWKKYFEKDRYGYSAQLVQEPDTGIKFNLNEKNQPSPGKPEQIWKWTDWYSIICSMILQYDHVYADISYILHDDAAILPLLKQTLQNKGLRDKVLYGTDFYVVRNHKSDRNMIADMTGGLDTDDFDTIARDNPRNFLYNDIHGNIPI